MGPAGPGGDGMIIRNNRKAPTGIGYQVGGAAHELVIAGGGLAALVDGAVLTKGTREMLDRGEIEDLQDGAPRAKVRNATRHTPIERTIRLEVPWAAHVQSPHEGIPRVKAIEIKPGETVNVRAEFLEIQGVAGMVEGGELEIVEAA